MKSSVGRNVLFVRFVLVRQRLLLGTPCKLKSIVVLLRSLCHIVRVGFMKQACFAYDTIALSEDRLALPDQGLYRNKIDHVIACLVT